MIIRFTLGGAASRKTSRHLPAGTKVVTTKRVQWHGLDIPKGTPGEIVRFFEDDGSFLVRFDDGRKHGSFTLGPNEFRVV